MVTIVACSILNPEISQVVARLQVQVTCVWMPPELHNNPLKLKEELEFTLKSIDGPKLVVYGRCFPQIDTVCHQYGAERIEGENCYEMVAGDRFYQILKKEPGTYFLLPQLCQNFEELTQEMHLTCMKDVFFKNYTQCILLDTGAASTAQCRTVAESLGLPLHTEYVGINILEKRLKVVLDKIE
jgi:hypothetical protein